MTETEPELEKLLSDAGLDDIGDRVIFPWGFHVTDFEGRTVLMAASPDEYRATVEHSTGKKLTEQEAQNPDCFRGGGGWCHSRGCRSVNGQCQKYHTGAHWVCVCSY